MQYRIYFGETSINTARGLEGKRKYFSSPGEILGFDLFNLKETSLRDNTLLNFSLPLSKTEKFRWVL